MPSQVRIFTSPRPLGETLAIPLRGGEPPKPVSEHLETPKPTVGTTLKARQYAMTSYQEEKSKGGVTFAHQDKLPTLPIPELASTCEKYIAALKPLQSPREHLETKHAVQEFLRNEGPELNEKLKRYAEGKSSYIEQFCK